MDPSHLATMLLSSGKFCDTLLFFLGYAWGPWTEMGVEIRHFFQEFFRVLYNLYSYK